ncbi:MAG: (deoxy)nucleoside triphosphate pyrophosphohydrolase [Sphaerochaetaceae bacterium]|jgi:8-oxo-dGTP diphosphatase|nr:(deoxy)nucleoside triphosphate pyrophosphohydrolase [Sphaerochaetaceae bacterium]
MKHIHVVAAVLFENGKVFAAKRNNYGELALKWEFPGGKVEAGETGETALAREIREELSSTISVETLLLSTQHTYTTFSLTMDAYVCRLIDGELTINEHIDCRWLAKHELFSVDWAEADIPIVLKISEMLGNVAWNVID